MLELLLAIACIPCQLLGGDDLERPYSFCMTAERAYTFTALYVP